MAFVTQLEQTMLKRTLHPDRPPIWEAVWLAEDNEESGYSAYDLRVLLKNVLTMQGKGK